MFNEFIVSNTIYCRRLGHGPALLFIHGSCVDSDFFLETAKALSKRFTVYIYDRRGYSRSKSIVSGDYTIQSQVNDALALLKTINTPCYLVAHSAGCAIAAELLISHPEFIKKSLLFEPVFMDYLSDSNLYQKEVKQINKYIKQGRYTIALAQFLQILGPSNNQLSKYTSEQLKRSTKNSMHFIKNEYNSFIQYNPDISSLPTKKIMIGLSEESHTKIFGTISINLSNILNCPLIAFPGGHNTPFDFPIEFSYKVEEIFS